MIHNTALNDNPRNLVRNLVVASPRCKTWGMRVPRRNGNTVSGAARGNTINLDMWRRTQNLVHNLVAYGTLSPDILLRYQVNRKLGYRLALSPDEWFETFWRREAIAPEIIEFVYTHVPQYSGLQVSRLEPGDRLEADLCWTQVCWFDWEMDLYDDVIECFGIDISEEFEFGQLGTVADLVSRLNTHILG